MSAWPLFSLIFSHFSNSHAMDFKSMASLLTLIESMVIVAASLIILKP
ncbi:hypothetical protein HMPREF1437_00084 [Helicobacter pylori HP116Bi]|nr:hypothetical protein HMPREF1437_00084 [Helicobacter pylori HP116Bi]